MINPKEYLREYYLPDVRVRVMYDLSTGTIKLAKLHMRIVNQDGGRAENIAIEVDPQHGAMNGLKGVIKAAVLQLIQDTDWKPYRHDPPTG